MLNAKNRLKKRKEFAYIYRKGKKLNGQSLSVFFVPSKNAYVKVGFSVSNKVGKAVIRNKVKRQLRNIMREIVPLLKNVNIVVLAYPEIVVQDYNEMQKNLKSILIKGKLIDE